MARGRTRAQRGHARVRKTTTGRRRLPVETEQGGMAA
jgi:hypothetical protein